MIVMSGGCRLLHTLLPLNLREERFVMGPGALTVIFWLRYLSEHVQYDSDDKLKVTSSPAGQAGGDQAGVALKRYLDSSLCCELSQTPLAISDKNLASLAARGNHLDVPEKVINTGANKGIDFQ